MFSKKNYEKLTTLRLKKPETYAATSDIGNVSNVVPTIHSWIGITSAGGPALHNPEFTDATMTDFCSRRNAVCCRRHGADGVSGNHRTGAIAENQTGI